MKDREERKEKQSGSPIISMERGLKACKEHRATWEETISLSLHLLLAVQ